MSGATTIAKIHRNLAENVQRLRGDRSLKYIAKLCSTREWKAYAATIQKIERMKYPPRLYTVHRLAIVLGTTIDELLKEPPKKNSVDESTKDGKVTDAFEDI